MDRYCRICWNTKTWCEPSGDARNLEQGQTYAVENGFGHEEWLFNYEYLYEAQKGDTIKYKYGFLQPIAKFQKAYENKTHNVLLYTVSPQGQKFAVAIIKNLFVPLRKELDYVSEKANKDGCVDNMARSLNNIGIESNLNTTDIFNVRYKPNDVHVFSPFALIPPSNKVYRSNRYHPLKWEDGYQPENSSAPEETHAAAGGDERSEAVRTKCTVMGMTYSPRHVQLQNIIYRYLCGEHGKKYVHYEMNYVDLTVKGPDETTFYEIKILPSVRACIRQALGQLLEYCHYPSHSKADKLIVVGDAPAQGSDITYLNNIRNRYQLRLFYRQWDREAGQFTDAV